MSATLCSSQKPKRKLIYQLCTVLYQHETSRRYSEFDDLRKKLIKLVGPEVKALAFPQKKAFGNKKKGVVDSRCVSYLPMLCSLLCTLPCTLLLHTQ
jgi:hypothetical protein